MSKPKEHIDPRVVRTRQLLRDALIALIHERGFESLTVKDITERATLNKATFYLHYKDIDDLLIQSTVELQEELVTAIGLPMITEATLTSSLLALLVLVFEHFALYKDFYDVVLNKIGTPPVIVAIQNPIETMSQRTIARLHSPDAVVDQDLIIRFMSSACIGLMQRWLATSADRSPKYMAEQCLNLLAYGIYNSLRHSQTEKENQPNE
ncbi:MAG: TetR/AcrR family transcriptional regulator [Anaerolineae bacterium]|nr:TetR/AcrR family transcriptional regulator [Anaerolineae bacterium]